MRSQSIKPEDLWRLKDRLSIVEAAILMTDHFPEDVTVRVKNGRIKSDKPIPGLEGAFSALREAAMNGDLPVTWAHDTHIEYEHGYFEHMGEQAPIFIALSKLPLKDLQSVTNAEHPSIRKIINENFEKTGSRRGPWELYIWEEPNWWHTEVEVSHLKAWLDGKGSHHPVFFREKPLVNNFRDPHHDRYSPSLLVRWPRGRNVKAQNPTRA